MKALLFERNMARFAASRLVSSIGGSGRGSAISPLRLCEVEPPELPGAGWYRVQPVLAGICGSDLATIDGRSSRYFEDVVSFPFVPGHEVVGVIERSAPSADGDDLAQGTRVVVEPVIGCVPRGIDPPCPACAIGDTGGCQRVSFGHLAPGLQIGYCKDTGGGWSSAGLVAHRIQLHPIPDTMSDEAAVMVEPAACAVHSALAAQVQPEMVVAVVGAGTLGLLTIAALDHLSPPAALIVGAKHPDQRRLALELGATMAVEPGQLARSVRLRSRSWLSSGQLTNGADVVIDCVGSADSLRQSIAMVRPRGRVVLVGMPGRLSVDLASLWHREVQLIGAYAYGTESIGGASRRTFELAMDLVQAKGLGRLVSARYPLERFEEALAHAGSAGRRGAVKVVFDLTSRPPRVGGSSRGRT